MTFMGACTRKLLKKVRCTFTLWATFWRSALRDRFGGPHDLELAQVLGVFEIHDEMESCDIGRVCTRNAGRRDCEMIHVRGRGEDPHPASVARDNKDVNTMDITTGALHIALVATDASCVRCSIHRWFDTIVVPGSRCQIRIVLSLLRT